MEISCPHCQFSKPVDPAQIPDRPVRVTCPKCRQPFRFDKTALAGDSPTDADSHEQEAATVTCPACGLEQPPGESCAGCGVVYARWQARMAADNGQTGVEAVPDRRVICQECGTVQTPADQCMHCGTILAPPAARSEYDYAGFWIRVVAYLIDSFIIGGVQLVLTLLLGATIGAMGEMGPDGEAAINMVVWLFSVVLGISYAVFFIGHCGQTPGKMALRIKVIRTDGAPISYGRAALREVPAKFLSGILLGIGYLMVAFDSRKQGLHDRIADTYVIKL